MQTMSNSCTLITGGAGFIGSNYVRHILSGSVERVVVLDKLTYAGSLENLANVIDDDRLVFVRGDIGDAECVNDLFKRHRPESVVNFAAESHVDRSIDSPSPFIDTNIRGTFVLLEASRKLFSQLEANDAGAFRFLHVSTDEVFGSLGDDGLFSETTPYAPNSPYAASKASADHLVRAYQHTYGLPALITNCSNNYGPYQFPEKLIPLMILNALEGKPLPIYGDGLNVRDWLYVDDHCTGIALALREGLPGSSYNIGGNNERSNIEVVDAICDALDRAHPAASNADLPKPIKSYKELKVFVEDRKGHDRRYAIDSSKIRRELSWSPTHDFATGMNATVQWYLEHIDWCAHVQGGGSYRRERLGLDADK
jgi:dTDP-glucose 4,6-dehydratase